LQRVCEAIDTLLATASRYHGLIPSILDRRTGEMLPRAGEPPPRLLPGQRAQDRSPRGCNLLHDVELLEAMNLLGDRLGRPAYREAAERYLARFAERCTQTPSGLPAWGEHAYWDLDRDALGNSQAYCGRTVSRGAYFDHLREAPVWLLRELFRLNAPGMERFVVALKGHWKSGPPPWGGEYFRHAYIEQPETQLPHEATSRDFARYSGFYILDSAVAYVRTRDAALRETFRGQLVRFADYWWTRRHPSGLLLQQSRIDPAPSAKPNGLALIQTLSLAVSLSEAARVLVDAGVLADDAKMLRERSGVYAQAVLNGPHDLERGRFAATLDPASGAVTGELVAWGSRYGSPWAVAHLARWMLRLYHAGARREGRYLAWAIAAAEKQAREPVPPGETVYAKDAGDALALLLDLHEITGERRWRGRAEAMAEKWLAMFLDERLPRAATAADWYEAQLGTGMLLLALARRGVS
jgi:hypothetical protein